MNDQRECETCPWPLDCCDEQRAAKPVGADCPRDAEVWSRRLGDARAELPQAAALAERAEAEEELLPA